MNPPLGQQKGSPVVLLSGAWEMLATKDLKRWERPQKHILKIILWNLFVENVQRLAKLEHEENSRVGSDH